MNGGPGDRNAVRCTWHDAEQKSCALCGWPADLSRAIRTLVMKKRWRCWPSSEACCSVVHSKEGVDPPPFLECFSERRQRDPKHGSAQRVCWTFGVLTRVGHRASRLSQVESQIVVGTPGKVQATFLARPHLGKQPPKMCFCVFLFFRFPFKTTKTKGTYNQERGAGPTFLTSPKSDSSVPIGGGF